MEYTYHFPCLVNWRKKKKRKERKISQIDQLFSSYVFHRLSKQSRTNCIFQFAVILSTFQFASFNRINCTFSLIQCLSFSCIIDLNKRQTWTATMGASRLQLFLAFFCALIHLIFSYTNPDDGKASKTSLPCWLFFLDGNFLVSEHKWNFLNVDFDCNLVYVFW